MAHKKAGGTTDLGRDSNPQYLGVKKSDGQQVKTGQIIIRQRGTKYKLGKNVFKGKDDTIHAKIDGVVSFTRKKITTFTGRLKPRTVVNVEKIAQTK